MNSDIRRLHSRLKGYLGRFLRRPEDVEEIAQEAFLKVLEAGSRGAVQNPEAYLYRTARNLALNSLSRKSAALVDYIEEIAGPDVISISGSLEEQIVAREDFELFCRTLARLPEQCRRVVVLHKVYGMSQREVADYLSLSVSTVEKHLAKGLLRCSQAMERHGYSLRRATGKTNQC